MAGFIRKAYEWRSRPDVPLCQLQIGDDEWRMYRQWVEHGGSADLYVLPDSTLMARGDKSEKAFAAGFVYGWRRRGEACQP